MDWNDDQIVAFDFEASGSLPEYALQPWRIPAGDTGDVARLGSSANHWRSHH